MVVVVGAPYAWPESTIPDDAGSAGMLELAGSVLHSVETWSVGLAASPWVFVVLLVLVVVDAFFPPVPSETLVIAVAAYSVSTGGPPLWAIVATTAVGAVVGDSIAYLLGRRLDLRGWRLLRGSRVQSAFGWAETSLAARPARFILSARFVPVGRVAVTMTAGAIRMPVRRFLVLVTIGGVSWAGYSTLIGVGSGVWLGDRPLLAMGLGVLGGLLVGYVVDWGVSRLLGPVRSSAAGRVRPSGPPPCAGPASPGFASAPRSAAGSER